MKVAAILMASLCFVFALVIVNIGTSLGDPPDFDACIWETVESGATTCDGSTANDPCVEIGCSTNSAICPFVTEQPVTRTQYTNAVLYSALDSGSLALLWDDDDCYRVHKCDFAYHGNSVCGSNGKCRAAQSGEQPGHCYQCKSYDVSDYVHIPNPIEDFESCAE